MFWWIANLVNVTFGFVAFIHTYLLVFSFIVAFLMLRDVFSRGNLTILHNLRFIVDTSVMLINNELNDYNYWIKDSAKFIFLTGIFMNVIIKLSFLIFLWKNLLMKRFAWLHIWFLWCDSICFLFLVVSVVISMFTWGKQKACF